jgi:hypothetical protein
MKLYLSWCAGSHHFHSKVLLTNLPAYLATVPTKELADKVKSPTYLFSCLSKKAFLPS